MTSILCTKQDFWLLWSLKESVYIMSGVVSKVELKIYLLSQNVNCISFTGS